jgi:cytosine/adenosine deaminase-related metal-dependent hydrolase
MKLNSSFRVATTVILALVSSLARADEPVHHAILFQGKPGGEQVTTEADGITHVVFSYRDNGRGPDLDEQIKVGADGAPTLYHVSGKSTFGAPVKESFSRTGDTVEWTSLSDQGKKTVVGSAAYVPVENSFETLAVIARAIARQPSRRLASLPGGELRLERLIENTSLTAGGRSIAVSLYAITGFSPDPTFLWLTDDAKLRFFAAIYPGFVTGIEKGWEAQGPVLEKLQVQAQSEWLARLAKGLSHHLPDPILIRNVRVFDSANARLSAPSDVYVNRGKIAAIYEPGATPRDVATVFDGTGKTVVPGMFDMHGHEDAWNAVLQIAGGVTSVRDLGNDNPTLADLMARIDSGQILGPRISPAGFIEGKSDFNASGGINVTSLQEAKDAVDWYAQHGYRQIKIYNSFKPEWVEGTAAYAHQRGLRVSGHIPAFMRAEEAVRAGYDEIQHINQVMLNFLVKPEDDTRTLARFTLIGYYAQTIDLDSPRVTAFIDLLKQKGTAIDPTLATFESMFTQRQGEMNPSYAAIAAHVPIGLARSWRTNSMDVTDANAETFRKSYQTLLGFTVRAHRAGIPLLAGTDGIAGFTLHRELELYVKAGIPAGEALRIATWNGARFTGTLDSTGSIEPRKNADLLLVEGDPVADISAMRRISMVMKGGVVYYPAEVYEAVGVQRFVEPPVPQAGK